MVSERKMTFLYCLPEAKEELKLMSENIPFLSASAIKECSHLTSRYEKDFSGKYNNFSAFRNLDQHVK